MMQQRKPNILRFRSWWQNVSKALNAVIVTPLVALLRIMVAWLRSWWQNTSKKRKIAQIIVLVVVVGLIVSFIGGYFFNWTWTGFGPYTPPTSGLQRGKTLYDWLQLAIIPAAIAFGVWSLNRLQQKRDQQLADQRAKIEREAADERAKIEREAAEKRAKTERDIALDNQREAALQAYIDDMSSLLLENDLSNLVDLEKVRKIGRVRTLTVLPRLDGRRKAIVLQFLSESGLIDRDKKINDKVIDKVIDLEGADFSGAELFRVQLSKADLSRANLIGANLIEANLIEAKLCSTILIEAKLSGAKLFGTDLRGVDLSKADLSGAIGISNENLIKEAKSLKDATMPNGTIHT